MAARHYKTHGMESAHKATQNAFTVAIRKAFPTIPLEDTVASVSTSNPKFGDYQCNNAMNILKAHKDKAGGASNPKEIGEDIKKNLSTDIFSSVVVAPQGFITVKITEQWMIKQLAELCHGPIKVLSSTPEKCLVDFSSPNIAKEMHVGHLRSTIIGESICRLLEFTGNDVKRINHLGDWGTQFGMLIEYMREKHPNFQENPLELSDLSGFYREAKKRFDEDADFKKRAQMSVVALQAGDAFSRAAWKLFCDISRKDFEAIYERLGVHLEERGESFYNEMIGPILVSLREKRFVDKSDGAECIFTTSDVEARGNEVPLIVVKRDGGYGYDSTDLAAIHHRIVVEGTSRVIYVTDVGQSTHFMEIFKVAERIGWLDASKTRVDHVGFGLVQGEDGKKFKTRSGDLVKLTSLLDEAVSRALAEIERRRMENPDQDWSLPVVDAAKAIGYSAVKYFDLKQHRTTNYRFSYEKMLDAKGNTAVYMMYAYARICAIFRKANVDAATLNEGELDLSHDSERQLAVEIMRFADIVEQMLEDLHIHRLAEYMYELTGRFTTFYTNCRVVGDEKQESRLVLCELVRKVLDRAFHLLGITALDKI